MKSPDEWAIEWADKPERARDRVDWLQLWMTRAAAVQDDVLASAPKPQAKFIRFALPRGDSIWICASSILTAREWNVKAPERQWTLLSIGCYSDGDCGCEVAEPIAQVLAKLEVSNAS